MSTITATLGGSTNLTNSETIFRLVTRLKKFKDWAYNKRFGKSKPPWINFLSSAEAEIETRTYSNACDKLMLPERLEMIGENCWIEVTKKMPIPCVDTILWRNHTFLMGWRTILPYRRVWALLGGRMARGESFAQTAIRQCRKSGVEIHPPRFVGIYPVKFPSRHDITICMAAKWKSGSPMPTTELSRYRWFESDRLREIRPIGANYRKMLRDWRMKYKEPSQ